MNMPTTKKRNICGEQVEQARKKLGLTQKELSEKLTSGGFNIATDDLANLEMGFRLVCDYELMVLSMILGVKVSLLLSAK